MLPNSYETATLPKRGFDGDVKAGLASETKLEDKKTDLGIFTGRRETTVTGEAGVGASGPNVGVGIEGKMSLENRLGDEAYCKVGANGGTGGASAGVECGLKGALNKNEKIGVAAGAEASTDRKIIGAGIEKTCMPDHGKGTETCTTEAKVSLLWRNGKFIYEETHPLPGTHASGPSQ